MTCTINSHACVITYIVLKMSNNQVQILYHLISFVNYKKFLALYNTRASWNFRGREWLQLVVPYN